MTVGLSETLILLFALALVVGCGIATMRIAAGKGRDSGGEAVAWFLLGFFFPLFGIVIALAIAPRNR